jgi:hypothetical protein
LWRLLTCGRGNRGGEKQSDDPSLAHRALLVGAIVPLRAAAGNRLAVFYLCGGAVPTY